MARSVVQKPTLHNVPVRSAELLCRKTVGTLQQGKGIRYWAIIYKKPYNIIQYNIEIGD